ncbi:MAG: PIG-L deacetylase family protein [Actinomycetota bacterium]
MSPRLALVFAHPDDDTFGVGGTIAMHRDELELLVILATSGDAGMIADPSLATRENLGEVREEESRASYRALGVEPEIVFLRHPDGELPEVDRETVVSQITERLEQFRPDVVVTFGQEGVTKHEDHIAIGEIATEAFHRAREGSDGGFERLFHVAIPQSRIEQFQELQRMAGLEPIDPDAPFQPRGVSDETVTVWADVMPVWERKHEALLAHETQRTEIDEIPEQARPLAFGHEHFVQAWPRPPAGSPRLRDLFEGLGS